MFASTRRGLLAVVVGIYGQQGSANGATGQAGAAPRPTAAPAEVGRGPREGYAVVDGWILRHSDLALLR